MTTKFRTATGQTGLDAYLFEATAIANAQRELNTRFHRLLDTVRTEQPCRFYDSTDFMFNPPATEANHFSHYLRGNQHYTEWLENGMRG